MTSAMTSELRELLPLLTPQERDELDKLTRSRKAFDPGEKCFGQQRDFVLAGEQFTAASCSRRAGKTYGAAAKLLAGYIRRGGKAPSLYFTLTRGTAKRIIWPTLLQFNREYRLGFEPNESELVLKKNGVGAIYLAGIDNKSEIEKLRGMGWGEVVGDEAQAFPPYAAELVNDVIMPSLMDHRGSLSLIGTPAPVPVGFFHDACHGSGFKHFAWTCFDNPHVTAKDHLERTLKMRGVTINDPSIRREFFGEWVHDENALVFRYDAARNALTALPASNSWQYVVGVDLGFDDADAIAVLAWCDESPGLYLVEERVMAKQTISALADQLKAVEAKYRPQGWVADFGGLGKKIAIEVTARTGIPLEAADKERKLEHIELLNDAMRTGRFFARPDGRFAQDCLLVEWDRTNPEKPKISDRFHSDQCDAVLYAFRRCLHWMHVPADEVPATGTSAAMEREAADYQRELEDRYERERAEELLNTNGNWGWQ